MVCAVGPSVTMSSTDFSSQNLVFKILFEFSAAEITLKSISPTFWISKEIPLNPAHQNLSKNTKRTFQFLHNFQLQFNLIFSVKIIQCSRTFALQVQMSWNQAHAPLLIENFQKTPKTRSEAFWFPESHNYKTNYLPS